MKNELADYIGISQDTNQEERIDNKIDSLKTEILAEIGDGKWHIHFLTGYSIEQLAKKTMQLCMMLEINGVRTTPVRGLSLKSLNKSKDDNMVFLLWSRNFSDSHEFRELVGSFMNGKRSNEKDGRVIIVSIPTDQYLQLDDQSEKKGKRSTDSSYKATVYNHFLLRAGMLLLSLSFLIWAVARWTWLYSDYGFYQLFNPWQNLFPFYVNTVFGTRGWLVRGFVFLTIVLTWAGIALLIVGQIGRSFRGRALLLAALVGFMVVCAAQTVHMLQYGVEYLNMGFATKLEPYLIDSFAIVLYTIFFTIPVIVLSERYRKILPLVALFISILALIQALPVITSTNYADNAYNSVPPYYSVPSLYVSFFPYVPYFSGPVGIFANYTIINVEGVSNFSFYALRSAASFLYFLSYILAFVRINDKIKRKHSAPGFLSRQT